MPSKSREVRKYNVQTIMKKYKGIKHKPKRKTVYCGKRTKLGLFEFLANVFIANERAAREDKLTNEAIEKMVIDEYNGETTLVKGFRSKKNTINYYRDLFNRGRLTNDEPPPVISYRYNADGHPVELRQGIRLLSAAERLEYSRKFFGIHSLLKQKKAEANRVPDATSQPGPNP